MAKESRVKKRLATARAQATKVKDAATRGAAAVGRQARARTSKAVGAAKQQVKNVLEAGANEILGGMEIAIEMMIDKTLDYTKGTVKHAVKDDDMPMWVVRGVDDVVEGVWPRVADIVKTSVMTGVHKQVPTEVGEPPKCCPNFLKATRAWLLYRMYPYDKSIWGVLRDPVWWFFNIVAAIPVYAVTQVFFFILFLLIDKTDEFQLIQFILQFKGFQFLTGGILQAIISSVQWYICFSIVGNCDKNGPNDHLWQYPIFCAQVLCVWLAFGLLTCSRKKSAPTIVARGVYQRKFDLDGDGKLDPDEVMLMRDHQRKYGRSMKHFDELPESTSYACCCCRGYRNRGGLIRYWMLYDAIIFCISVGVALVPTLYGPYALTTNSVHYNFGLEKAIFYTKMFYFLLSFPWVFFIIPVLGNMMTRSTPSAYNRAGETVPLEPLEYTGKRHAKAEDEEEEEDREQEEAQNVSKKVLGLLDKIRRGKKVKASSESDEEDGGGQDGEDASGNASPSGTKEGSDSGYDEDEYYQRGNTRSSARSSAELCTY